MTSTPTLAQLRADIVKLYASIAGVTSGNSLVAAEKVKLNAVVAILDGVHGTAAVVEGKSGDFKSYSEVNATVTGSVTAGDVTMTAAMSVDAGAGYTFADDKTFDTASAGRVGLDNVTIATSMGTFKIDDGAIVHLVDAGDETNADILYTNTFGSMSVSVAIDANKDTDDKAAKAVDAVIAYADGNTAVAGLTTVTTVGVAAVAADVAWSAKVSMPVAGGTAYIAMDEEGGNIFCASTTLSGVGISFSSKLEALEEEISADRDNSIGLTYALGATKLGATWNSVEDGDQWGISAAYTADGMTINASTDEGSDWSVSGSYLMGTGASVVGGVNYTEDAYLGLSFSF